MTCSLSRVLMVCTLAWVQTTSVSLADSQGDIQAQGARALWHQQIGVGYKTLSESAQALKLAATGYCQSPDEDTRLRLESMWQEAFMDWQAVRFVDFGPIEINSRAWQLQFWPDPKNLVGTKARQLLSSGTPIDQQRLTDFGVAAEGFPMLEYLLFDNALNQTDQALPGDHSCDLLVATANTVEENAMQLDSEWTTLREHYLATEAYTATTVRAAMTALDILVSKRLGEPMGLGSSQRRLVYAGDAWRSGQSLAAIEATLTGIQTYFLPGLILQLQQAGLPELATDLSDQLQSTLERFDALPSDLESVLEDDQAYAKLQGLYVNAGQLEQLLSRQAAGALAIRQGFNSSDGD